MNDKLKKYYETYDYTSRTPIEISLDQLTTDQRQKLVESKHFCMLPWTHLHGWPTGEAYPCCLANDKHPIGNLRTQTLEEVWNDEPLRQMRVNMLDDSPSKECNKCYEQENMGFFSLRNSSNKAYGHHIGDIDKTLTDGTHPEFKIRYWDVRFSNICNFKCRYCGPNFSSNWYDDKVALYGKDSVKHNKIIYSGKDKHDIWNQMQQHIPYLEQIYFAGGEPLIMEEHYKLLNLLIEKNLTHVRLVYNTNFSDFRYKKQNVLDLWKNFTEVCVGASLDAMGTRAEYMRKGTVWSKIENNRRILLEECPWVDFYISATVNIFNVMHIGDFHKDWVEKELIKPQDLNVNILQGPQYYRCDVLPAVLKEKTILKLQEMIEWLEPVDKLHRAVNGYRGIINFMQATDNSRYIPHFMAVTDQLDKLRKEKFEDVFPELKELREYS